MMLAAATITDNATLDFVINQVHNYAASNMNNTACGVYYDPSLGSVDNALYNAAGVNS